MGEITEIQEPAEIPEANRLQEYDYCQSNQEVIDSKAGKLEFFNALKEEFGEKEGKKLYQNIYKILGGFGSTKEESEEIKENIVDNKGFIDKLKDVLYKKLKGTGEELDSENITMNTIIILLSNALVKEDIVEIIGNKPLDKILKEYKFGETIDGVNNENSEIFIEEDLEKYIILNINSNNYYIINKNSKEKIECSSYEKINFGNKEVFIVKDEKGYKILSENDKGDLEEKIEGKEVLTGLIEYGFLVVKKEDKYILLNENFEENYNYYFNIDKKPVLNELLLKVFNNKNEAVYIDIKSGSEIEEYSQVKYTNIGFVGEQNGKDFLVNIVQKSKVNVTGYNKEVLENNNLLLCGYTEEIKKDKGSLTVRKSDKNFYGIFNEEGKELFPEEEISEFFINEYGNNPYFGIKIDEYFYLISKKSFNDVFKTQNTNDFKSIFTSTNDDSFFKEIDGRYFLENMFGDKKEIIPRKESKWFWNK